MSSRLLAALFVLILAGCSRPEAPETETTAAESPEASAPVNPDADFALPPVPTHWTNSKPIGDSKGPATDADLRAGLSNPSSWLLYGGNYGNFRHSPDTDLNPDSVKHLEVAWAFATGTEGQFEASPVVYDGIMYVSSSYNRLFALNPETGELYWRYDHQLPDDMRLCCGPVNRGVAITGDEVIMATLDAKLVALNRLSGDVLWETEIAPYAKGFSATSMPMIVKDMAIIGVAGGEFGVRGFFDAYDVKTGKRRWRHYTVPDTGEPGTETWKGESYKTGGAPAWTSGAYDPDTDTLFWTTGNPAPDWNGDAREGDNLYSDSVLALDPDTGKLKWYFQFTPHDVWDYDGNSQIFLTDVHRNGKTIKAIVQANRNGYFYTLDRASGTFLDASQYLEQVNWATIDEIGRPIVNPDALPSENPSARVCPSAQGGMNGAWTGSLDPDRGLAFIPSIEACQQYQKGLAVYIEGQNFFGGMPDPVDVNDGKAYGTLSAIDYNTGKVKWRYKDADPMMGGAVSTAGGVVFTGNQQGFALALDSDTGKLLWKFRMGSGVRSQPIVYSVNGKSYVAMGSGNWASMVGLAGGPLNIPEGGHLFVFTLKP